MPTQRNNFCHLFHLNVFSQVEPAWALSYILMLNSITFLQCTSDLRTDFPTFPSRHIEYITVQRKWRNKSSAHQKYQHLGKYNANTVNLLVQYFMILYRSQSVKYICNYVRVYLWASISHSGQGSVQWRPNTSSCQLFFFPEVRRCRGAEERSATAQQFSSSAFQVSLIFLCISFDWSWAVVGAERSPWGRPQRCGVGQL